MTWEAWLISSSIGVVLLLIIFWIIVHQIDHKMMENRLNQLESERSTTTSTFPDGSTAIWDKGSRTWVKERVEIEDKSATADIKPR